MKCHNCGTETDYRTCPSCGTVIKKERYFLRKNLLNFLHIKWVNFLFPLSSTIILILIGILLCYCTSDGKRITFTQWIIIMIMFFIMFILPYDLIRWGIWGKRKYIKKTQKRLDMYTTANRLLDKANSLAQTINSTTNRVLFEKSLSELKDTFNKMIQYEKYGIFKDSTPSEDLQKLLEKEPKVRQALEERIIEDARYTRQREMNRIYADFDNMDGHEFEYYCADILRKNRFINVEVTQGSGDHGIDILAEKDGITYAIQCKCYSSNIGNAAVQQAHTGKSLYHKDIAVVLTNQHFTTQAKEEAAALGVKLWDREVLTNLIAAAE
jgi:uncharacterized membrane protein SirB2